VACAMTRYRFYFISKQKSIVGVPESHDCADDAAALIRAGEIASGSPKRAVALEVWESRRLVGRIPVTHSKHEHLPAAKASLWLPVFKKNNSTQGTLLNRCRARRSAKRQREGRRRVHPPADPMVSIAIQDPRTEEALTGRNRCASI
jgi:hypothetical protein